MIRRSVERARSAIVIAGRLDRGFTILEPLIAMLVLMMVAIGLLPILTQSLLQSVKNAELVSATSLASQAIEDERGLKTCSALTSLNQSTVVATTVTLKTIRTISSCPATFPGTVTVTVTVSNLASGLTDASAATLVFVTGA